MALTACPPSQQLSIRTNAIEKMAEFDLNYVYN